MRTAALSRHLAVFDQRAPRGVVEPVRIAPTVETANETLEAARAEGYAQGCAQAAAESAAREKQLEEAFAQRLAAAQAAWRNETVDRLSRELGEGFSAIEQELAEAVADLLAPVVEGAKTAGIVAAFQSCLHELLADGAVASVKLDAPPDMIDKLAVQSLFDGRFIDIRAGAPGECRARIDRTIVRARLESWIGEVENASERGAT